MATAIKWIFILLIIGALGFLVWWSGWLGAAPVPTPIEPAPTATPEQPTNGMSAANDTSDAGVAQDTAAVDVQMQALATDSANVDSSMSDKQTPQDY